VADGPQAMHTKQDGEQGSALVAKMGTIMDQGENNARAILRSECQRVLRAIAAVLVDGFLG